MHWNERQLPPPRWRGLRRVRDVRQFWDHGECCDNELVVQLCFEGLPSGTRDRNWVNDHHGWIKVDTEFERQITWRR